MGMNKDAKHKAYNTGVNSAVWFYYFRQSPVSSKTYRNEIRISYMNKEPKWGADSQ